MDYRQPITLADVFDCLNIIQEHLPVKEARDKYMIAPKEPKPSPGDEGKSVFERDMESLVEHELTDVERGYDIRAIEKILHVVNNVKDIVQDAMEDIELHLGEHRASILSVVLSYINSVHGLEWDGTGKVTIETGMPLDDDIIRDLRHEIGDKHQELDLDKILTEPKYRIHERNVIYWTWVC